MARRLKFLFGVAIVFATPQLLRAADITLESLSARIDALVQGQSDSNDRISAIEIRLAPTPTKTRRPTRTPTPTRQRPSPTATVFSTPTPESLLRVSAEELFADYKSLSSARLKYGGKTVEVYGKVIKKEADRVELDVPGWFSYFVCLDEQENLRFENQEVVLQGENVNKESNTISMRNCVFVSPAPTELNRLYAARVASTATARSMKATATTQAQEIFASGCKGNRASCRSNCNRYFSTSGFSLFECLGWTRRQMNTLIKTNLNDPNSMEVHSTRITPEVDGTHIVIVDFGAKNALGGVVRNIARGLVDHETCEALVVLEIEPK